MNRVAGASSFVHSKKRKDEQGGKVAYVAQTAWLKNDTIRENILFGNEYDSERYEKVIRDCALIKDLKSLDGGDLTEIGERGINLSGSFL
jgi:ATP-binding cassette subfamily C (CFTR/MRP) protein 1